MGFPSRLCVALAMVVVQHAVIHRTEVRMNGARNVIINNNNFFGGCRRLGSRLGGEAVRVHPVGVTIHRNRVDRRFRSTPLIVNGSAVRRDMCERCHRAKSVCICDSFPTQKTPLKTKIFVLMHWKESRRTVGTGYLCEGILGNSSVVVWRPGSKSIEEEADIFFRENPDFAQALRSPDTVALYPGPDSVALDQMVRASTQEGLQHVSVEGGQQVRTLVVLDGTWHETKEMLRRLPSLNRLKQAKLPLDLAGSADGRLMIRRCKRKRAQKGAFVCTLGAIVAALEVIEPEVARSHRKEWLSPLHKLVEVQIRQLPEDIQIKKGREILDAYRKAGVPILGPLKKIPGYSNSHGDLYGGP